MIPLPSGSKVWLGRPHRMRKGIGGRSLLVQEVLARDPFCGYLFVFPRPSIQPDQSRLA